MLLSTCPKCGAQFKVAPEQLNIRQGRVMCGRCRHVFNAFESLKRVEDNDPAEITDYSIVDSGRNEAAAEAATEAPTLFQSIEPPVPAELLATRVETTQPITPISSVAPIEIERTQTTFDTYEAAVEKIEHLDEAAVIAENNALSTNSSPPSFVTVTTVTTSNADALLNPVIQTEDQVYPPDVSQNPLITGEVPRDRRPSRAWPWLATLSTIGLLLQVVYFYRSEIVQQYPQLRPQFVAACSALNCQIAWGRDQDAIKIESSDLIEPPGKPGRILLTATIANRASTKHDFPLLEVKLMDAGNMVLSSRVFTPPEYLGRVPSPEEGMTPNIELYINLNLELAAKTTASGYGLRAFYP